MPLSVWETRGFTKEYVENNHSGKCKAKDGVTDLFKLVVLSESFATGSRDCQVTTHTKTSDPGVDKALKAHAKETKCKPKAKAKAEPLTQAQKENCKKARSILTGLSPLMVQLSVFDAEKTSAVLPLVRTAVAEANARVLDPRCGPMPQDIVESWKSWLDEGKSLTQRLSMEMKAPAAPAAVPGG